MRAVRLSQPRAGRGRNARSAAAACRPVAEFVAISWPQSLAAPALIGLSCKSGPVISGGFVDDDSTIGHALRDGTLTTRAREQRRVAVAIVGGGIGGLSAGWRLDALGVRDWLLLELADAPGGNARSGSNDAGRFPWGAHYLPVPGPDAVHVRQLLRELGVLDASGQFDERTLCHSPQERIFQHGRWHEGLEPFDALPSAERAQFARFDEMIREWRASGAFRVPSAQGHEHLSSGAMPRDAADAVRALDTQTADTWLRSQGLTSPALRWWVEYGTRDDYGASLAQASAWAAVHYFAARDADEAGPLTWPEGNGWLVQQLAARAGERIVTGAPAVHLERQGVRWIVRTPRVDVTCDVVIWAAPLFVLPKVLPTVSLPAAMEYAPWVVANLTLRRPPSEQGAPPAWDNVIYDSPSLGYVDAGHQSLATRPDRRVWTWYHAVVDRTSCGWSPMDATADVERVSRPDHRAISRAHIRILPSASSASTSGAGVMRWRVPCRACWRGSMRCGAGLPLRSLYCAHADLSGLSLFEEAQWHGVEAAEHAARQLGQLRSRTTS